MVEFFNTFLTQPLFNLLIFIYDTVPGNDIGVAIVILTILIKLALYPLSQQSIKGQKALQDLQPKIEELKKKYKNDKETMAKETMELYKREKVNPLSSCLPLLIQLPFLIAVFHMFNQGFEAESLKMLYSFVPNPGQVNPVSLGLVDLSSPNLLLAAITGLAQFWQTKMLIHKKQPQVPGAKDEDMMAAMNKQMLYFMPIITVVIGASLPAGLVLYWLLTTVLTALQQKVLFKKKPTNEVEVLPKS